MDIWSLNSLAKILMRNLFSINTKISSNFVIFKNLNFRQKIKYRLNI